MSVKSLLTTAVFLALQFAVLGDTLVSPASRFESLPDRVTTTVEKSLPGDPNFDGVVTDQLSSPAWVPLVDPPGQINPGGKVPAWVSYGLLVLAGVILKVTLVTHPVKQLIRANTSFWTSLYEDYY